MADKLSIQALASNRSVIWLSDMLQSDPVAVGRRRLSADLPGSQPSGMQAAGRLLRKALDLRRRVHCGPRLRERGIVQIRGVHLHVFPKRLHAERLREQHRHRVRLLAAGDARAPDPYSMATGRTFPQWSISRMKPLIDSSGPSRGQHLPWHSNLRQRLPRADRKRQPVVGGRLRPPQTGRPSRQDDAPAGPCPVRKRLPRNPPGPTAVNSRCGCSDPLQDMPGDPAGRHARVATRKLPRATFAGPTRPSARRR
jgi:hypothetical protein